MQLLLNNGAYVYSCKGDGKSPLYVACEYGRKNTVHVLLTYGVDINLGIENGESPLQNGHDGTVQL